ncbi:Ni/Fe hydrogenase subunit alpha [Pontibacterium sp.]|uniref:Ni/Fe hydrogenase subunit alpha n=1 Tax=Pontibacterium sp. TaxID=2036026 RepID=UPI003516D1FD
MSERNVSIKVPILARVEGEGALHLEIKDNQIEKLQFSIYEPPRFFEKFLEGRSYTEVPDIVARICGICPVAYQVSAVNAIEAAFGLQVDPWITEMRRLLYFGEWIESHALHIHLLAAPDFFGCESGIALAKEYPHEVKRGLQLQGLGNEIMRLMGGRSVHPSGVKVGGFHKAPALENVDNLLAKLQDALPEAEAMVDWIAGIGLPDVRQDFTSVALTNRTPSYAIENGLLKTSSGLELAPERYESHFCESHASHSTALWSHLDGKPYLVGPLARLNLNYDKLRGADAQQFARYAGHFPSHNMFDSMLARGLEICFALREAIRILSHYQLPDSACVEVVPQAGEGAGWSEAPRGLLWHRYQLDESGIVRAAKIVPPTSQNQARIEEDLQHSLHAFGLQHSDDELRLHCEKVVRNYDPCISCATHFLKLSTVRR